MMMMNKVSIQHHHHVSLSIRELISSPFNFRFYLATQQDDPLALFINRSMDKSSFPTALENWFGNTIYENAHPRMPSDHVLAASDLEQ